MMRVRSGNRMIKRHDDLSLAAFNNVNPPTDGDDVFEVGPDHIGESIDGGGGVDTVLLKPLDIPNGHEFGIYSPDFFKNIEIIQGSASEEEVTIDARIFSTLGLFDGGGGNDKI